MDFPEPPARAAGVVRDRVAGPRDDDNHEHRALLPPHSKRLHQEPRQETSLSFVVYYSNQLQRCQGYNASTSSFNGSRSNEIL